MAAHAEAAIFFVALEMGRRSISARRGTRTPSTCGVFGAGKLRVGDLPTANLDPGDVAAGNFGTRTKYGASRILRKVTVWRAVGKASSCALMPKADSR